MLFPESSLPEVLIDCSMFVICSSSLSLVSEMFFSTDFSTDLLINDLVFLRLGDSGR